MKILKKYAGPLGMLVIFETIAVVLWLTMDNLFYLFNFSYIGAPIALGLALYVRKYKARTTGSTASGGALSGISCLSCSWHLLLSLLRVKVDKSKCISCGKCERVCPMNVAVTDNRRNRKNGTECILCMECVDNCPKGAIRF